MGPFANSNDMNNDSDWGFHYNNKNATKNVSNATTDGKFTGTADAYAKGQADAYAKAQADAYAKGVADATAEIQKDVVTVK
jgi:flagellar biosynthesis/type III secretory pathway protein FliH